MPGAHGRRAPQPIQVTLDGKNNSRIWQASPISSAGLAPPQAGGRFVLDRALFIEQPLDRAIDLCRPARPASHCTKIGPAAFVDEADGWTTAFRDARCLLSAGVSHKATAGVIPVSRAERHAVAGPRNGAAGAAASFPVLRGFDCMAGLFAPIPIWRLIVGNWADAYGTATAPLFRGAWPTVGPRDSAARWPHPDLRQSRRRCPPGTESGFLSTDRLTRPGFAPLGVPDMDSDPRGRVVVRHARINYNSAWRLVMENCDAPDPPCRHRIEDETMLMRMLSRRPEPRHWCSPPLNALDGRHHVDSGGPRARWGRRCRGWLNAAAPGQGAVIAWRGSATPAVRGHYVATRTERRTVQWRSGWTIGCRSTRGKKRQHVFMAGASSARTATCRLPGRMNGQCPPSWRERSAMRAVPFFHCLRYEFRRCEVRRAQRGDLGLGPAGEYENFLVIGRRRYVPRIFRQSFRTKSLLRLPCPTRLICATACCTGHGRSVLRWHAGPLPMRGIATMHLASATPNVYAVQSLGTQPTIPPWALNLSGPKSVRCARPCQCLRA